MSAKLIIALILSGIGVVFLIQNVEVITITFFFWSFAISQALLVFLLIALGICVGWLLHRHSPKKKKA